MIVTFVALLLTSSETLQFMGNIALYQLGCTPKKGPIFHYSLAQTWITDLVAHNKPKRQGRPIAERSGANFLVFNPDSERLQQLIFM